jgi:lycopene beta-cyclase
MKNISYVNQKKVTDINELENHVFVATETDSYYRDTVLIVFTTKPKLKIKTISRVATAFYRLVYKSKRSLQSRPSYFHGFFGGAKGNTVLCMYCLPQPPKLY